jgi:hypothetical protein
MALDGPGEELVAELDAAAGIALFALFDAALLVAVAGALLAASFCAGASLAA